MNTPTEKRLVWLGLVLFVGACSTLIGEDPSSYHLQCQPPGAVDCLGDTPRVCGDNGLWAPKEPCSGQTCADGQCVDGSGGAGGGGGASSAGGGGGGGGGGAGGGGGVGGVGGAI